MIVAAGLSPAWQQLCVVDGFEPGAVNRASLADWCGSPPSTADRVVNPIGCGHCLAAGIAWALGQGIDMASAVDQGMALAAENLRTALPSDFDGRRERIARR